jgi:hypothetical protein
LIYVHLIDKVNIPTKNIKLGLKMWKIERLGETSVSIWNSEKGGCVIKKPENEDNCGMVYEYFNDLVLEDEQVKSKSPLQ